MPTWRRAGRFQGFIAYVWRRAVRFQGYIAYVKEARYVGCDYVYISVDIGFYIDRKNSKFDDCNIINAMGQYE